jgi:hypothetical protein
MTSPVALTDLIGRIKTYFENMVAISLLHEPKFHEKINKIESASQVHAMLAAMLAYAARFYPTGDDSPDIGFEETNSTHRQAAHFLNLALVYIDDALKECGDEAPPLCILQALIISTHCQLTQGVRGKAWRSLGMCVRLAYELNLHLVDGEDVKDIGEVDPNEWCDNEEKRRAWWAIWEMDVFASTIRRTPTAVDWSQIETFLPVEDKYWFQNQPRPSCFMESDPIYRWKALQECGNQSSKAWFLVINSLMKEAQMISSPRGVPYTHQLDDRQPHRVTNRYQGRSRDISIESHQKLETLSNSVRCFGLALPAYLKYRNQYLTFDATVSGQKGSLRKLHCGIHNIFVMTQLARLMIHRYNVFGGQARAAYDSHYTAAGASNNSAARNNSPSSTHDIEELSLRQYFEAADNILAIVHRSSDDHIQYINPFLSSTIWLASAVQLVHKEFGPPGTNRSLIKSKFEVLYMTYKRCIRFWDTQTALQQNLEMLETQLEEFRNSEQRGQLQPGDRNGQNNVYIAAGTKTPWAYGEETYGRTNGNYLDNATGLVNGRCMQSTYIGLMRSGH